MNNNLNKNLLERYSRQILLKDIGVIGQKKILNSKVLIVGAGGLGEDVNRALGRIEPGEALLAGLGIVFLAIIVDRITQSAAKKRQAALEGPKL